MLSNWLQLRAASASREAQAVDRRDGRCLITPCVLARYSLSRGLMPEIVLTLLLLTSHMCEATISKGLST